MSEKVLSDFQPTFSHFWLKVTNDFQLSESHVTFGQLSANFQPSFSHREDVRFCTSAAQQCTLECVPPTSRTPINHDCRRLVGTCSTQSFIAAVNKLVLKHQMHVYESFCRLVVEYGSFGSCSSSGRKSFVDFFRRGSKIKSTQQSNNTQRCASMKLAIFESKKSLANACKLWKKNHIRRGTNKRQSFNFSSTKKLLTKLVRKY